MALRNKRTKVGRACQRCRRQKLRCDIQRPCTLCVHAGTDCQNGPADQFRPFQVPAAGSRNRLSHRQAPSEEHEHSDSDGRLTDQPWSSSTMSLVAGAFEYHNSATPDVSMTTAMPGGQEPHELEIPVAANTISLGNSLDRPHRSNLFLPGSRSVTAELLSLLPPREVASLLVDTYFDRVHWFMLIFHQEDFRQKWQTLYHTPVEDLVETPPNPGFISIFLVVIAIALQYTGKHRQQTLETHNTDPGLWKEKIFSTIRSKLLDIVSTGSIEAVQTCVLLGTYYLYHGSPSLAWPVCGCGLRIAQALKLHRKVPIAEPVSADVRRKIETRKRCWWAIYEIETFCSISYGYPHGIVDADCNVELLDPLATSSGQLPTNYDEIHRCPASLLSYKYLMSKLSVFLKDVLHDLYGIGSHHALSPKGRPMPLDSQGLLRKVPLLEGRLQKWKAEIPDCLRLEQSASTTYSSAEEMDCDIGASGPSFESHIYQLQALSLLLAYENARILVHRPLLTFRTKIRDERKAGCPLDPSELTSHLTLRACRDAAMNTSYIEESPIFSLAADTYAAAFISIHTFTAGVTLCVLTSIDPLTPESQQSKLGLRRLLSMQAHLKLKSKSPLSAQGLDILERLTRLVLEKELKEILSPINDLHSKPPETETQGHEHTQDLSATQPQPQWDGAQEPAERGSLIDYVEDTTISQALFDLDQVLSGHDLNMSSGPFFSDPNESSNGFAQEQAWIWGLENPM